MQRLQLLLTGGFLLASLSVSAGALAADTQLAQQVPLIVPQLVSVIEQKKCIKQNKYESCAEINLSLETTSVPWLDHALLKRLEFAEVESASQPTDLQQHLQQVKQQAAILIAEKYNELTDILESDDPYFISYDHFESIRFIAQRNHLASFKQFSYDYTGGAHGMHSTSYLLYDLNTRRQLLLADILQPFAYTKLFEALYERYQQSYTEYAQNWLNESPSKQAEILLTDNFIFNEQGLIFNYPPYVLGPFSEGDVLLKLDYNQLNGILKPEYVFDN